MPEPEAIIGLLQTDAYRVCCEARDGFDVRDGGRIHVRCQPDATKAYLMGDIVTAFPVVNRYASAFTARVLQNSYLSLEHQGFNFQHRMAANSELLGDEVREDRVLGSVVAVEFPRPPAGGWRLTDAPRAPALSMTAGVTKRAKGMDRMLGSHQSGRHEWMFSIEFDAGPPRDQGIVLLAGESELPESVTGPAAEHTPEDFARAGLLYLPWSAAPEELTAHWNPRAFRGVGGFDRPFHGRPCVTLMGGLEGRVHFFGAAVVEYGAFETAKILRIAAEDRPGLEALETGLREMDALLERYWKA